MKNLSIEKSISDKEEIESVSSERISTPPPSSTCMVIHNIVVSDEESNPASPCRSMKIASPSITQEHEEKDFPSSPSTLSLQGLSPLAFDLSMNLSDREEIQSIEPKEMEEEKDVMEIIEEQINQTVLEEKTEEEVNHIEKEEEVNHTEKEEEVNHIEKEEVNHTEKEEEEVNHIEKEEEVNHIEKEEEVIYIEKEEEMNHIEKEEEMNHIEKEEEVNHTETEVSSQAITSSTFSPSSPKQTISQPQLSITTPPRSSLKRQIICNDSPIISPSKIISISQPTFVTPVKKQIHNTKSIEVSPTKVQTDIEVIEENNTISLSSKVKRLLKEQEEERNQFRRLMKRQITAIQNNFELGLSRWSNV